MSTPFSDLRSGKPMQRSAFVISIALLLIAAYLALRLILLFAKNWESSFPNGWQFLDPLGLIVGEGPSFMVALMVHVALAIGLAVIGVRRARDAGWAPWIGLTMALPVVRLFVFVALAVVPSAHHTHVLDLPREGRLGRIIPHSRLGSAVAAVVITTLLVIPLGFVNVRILEDYGLALFIGIPFLLGAMSAYLHSYHTPRTLPQSLTVAGISMLIVLALIFFLAMEGLVCLIMATPIAGSITVAGALIGHSLSRNEQGRTPAMTLLVVLTPTLMAFEAVERGSAPMFNVVSSLHVNASPQQVWDQLVTFSHMDEPTELVFRAGISYPIEARINGTGVGACRYCQFNTGPFVEPITVWNEPHLLAFDVQAFPPPMTELSIYENVNAPHIHGFFQSHHGQFKLIEQADGTTLLEGTTWYTHEIWPTWYWKLWSDNILHAIHGRVLEHIKKETELSH